jgi:glycosyltransferase involved in cell wall biosynthesis
MNKITYCIPSKDNLRYLKSSIKSIKENSNSEYEIIVFVDTDNDGTEHWLKQEGVRYILNKSEHPIGIAAGYNRCIEAAETDVVCMFHADMYMAKGFDTNLLKHLKSKVVVAATRIEPPLHPAGLEKIIQDFGMYPEDFEIAKFNAFITQATIDYKDQITYGIFAPWACYKSDLLEINLHDEYFHSYHEDSDIFNRMILHGMICIQSRDSFVYHLTCRGGQFQDGIDKITTNPQFHHMKNTAHRNYLRKWGSWIKNNEYQHPIITPKYNIAFVVQNCTLPMLETLEPWCDRIYIDDAMQVLTIAYAEKEQPNTRFDLTKRIFHIGHNDPHGENDIVVEFDAKQLSNHNFQYIQQLAAIIKDSGAIGEFEIDIFKITIYSLEEQQDNLIILKQ